MSMNHMIFWVFFKKVGPPFTVCKVIFSCISGALINLSAHLMNLIFKNALVCNMFDKIKLDLTFINFSV